jgi:branched-chain amino acid transport system ATP-binding protein
VLELTDVVCAYGPVRAVDEVSLDVPEGSVTAVLGANGAGKTSLLSTISGLVRARSGTLRFDGRDITRMSAEQIVRLGLAHVPEGGGAIGELLVEDNLRLGSLWRRDSADRAKALGEVYELFPRLEERRKQLASSLSIGRALMGRPRMILFDEPSLGLAPMLASRIMRLIGDLRERTGLTVLIVEQNAKSALAVADRGVVLNLGRVVAEGESAELRADDQLRRAYLGY